jgi:hypothetical protein
MSNSEIIKEDAFFSTLCIERCKGRCCAPWWGVVSFTLRKDNGLSGLSDFKRTVIKAVAERELRIRDNYITSDAQPRALFEKPEKYFVPIEELKINGTTLLITLRAMYAFRCLFLTDENECGIHPGVIGGEDIRPPHCGYMGTLNAEYGDKGYCRIIHTAAKEGSTEKDIDSAIELEEESSRLCFEQGKGTIDEAVEVVMDELTKRCKESAPELFPKEGSPAKVGRNDPCTCGSGKKFKKCCGQ